MHRASVLAAAAFLVLPGCIERAFPPSEVEGPVIAPGGLGDQARAVGEIVAFRVADPRAGARYFWSFGDGSTELGPETDHAYTTPGRFSVAVHEVVGESVTRVATGVVRVADDLRLAGRASENRGSSESRFEVRPNATGILLEFRGVAREASQLTVTLADPTGKPVVVHDVEIAGFRRLPIAVERPDAGDWLLVVEAPGAGVDWVAEGRVGY